jgi:hypothetical protein
MASHCLTSYQHYIESVEQKNARAYNDVRSLYPCSMSVTHVLEITGAEPCSPSARARTFRTLSDGEHLIPFILDAKGRGDLAFFRSKNYILKTEREPVFARHGCVYYVEDFLKLFDGTLTELQTRQDVKHTLLTHTKEALKMAKGRWRTKPVTLTLEKIELLLEADVKRSRENADSYGLVMQKQSSPSTAWNYEQMLLEPKEIFRFS